MKIHGPIIKIDVHTIRQAAERIEREGGRMELTTFGVAIKINDAVQVIPWRTVDSATSNVLDDAIAKVIETDSIQKTGKMIMQSSHADVINPEDDDRRFMNFFTEPTGTKELKILEDLISASDNFLRKAVVHDSILDDAEYEELNNSANSMEIAQITLQAALDNAIKILPVVEATPVPKDESDDECRFTQHEAVQQSDEWFCGKCGKRWGVDEDAPGCV